MGRGLRFDFTKLLLGALLSALLAMMVAVGWVILDPTDPVTIFLFYFLGFIAVALLSWFLAWVVTAGGDRDRG